MAVLNSLLAKEKDTHIQYPNIYTPYKKMVANIIGEEA
jgi:hypothetical protein